MITADEVTELRSLLRRRDPVVRQFATTELAAWPARTMTSDAARSVLDATVESYPALPGDSSHPADLFARVLWSDPAAVKAQDVCRVFFLAVERVRRTLLTLLAIRADEAGLIALEHLLGADGPTELVPAPTTPVLDPLVDVATPQRLVELLLPLLGRPGWAWHTAELLGRLRRDGRIDDDVAAAILERIDQVVAELVDQCDRTMIGESTHSDPSRSERESLATIISLVELFDSPAASAPLRRALSSADPRVAALAAGALLRRGDAVASERLPLIAKDPLGRAVLHAQLVADPRTRDVLPTLIDPAELAEAKLVTWLAQVTEVGFAPDEIEFVTALRVDAFLGAVGDDQSVEPVEPIVEHGPIDAAHGETDVSDSVAPAKESRSTGPVEQADPAEPTGHAEPDGSAESTDHAEPTGHAEPAAPTDRAEPNLWVFRFRMRAPHWSSARGWMIGTAGVWTFSCYHAEDEMTMREHVEAIRRSLVEWPGRF